MSWLCLRAALASNTAVDAFVSSSGRYNVMRHGRAVKPTIRSSSLAEDDSASRNKMLSVDPLLTRFLMDQDDDDDDDEVAGNGFSLLNLGGGSGHILEVSQALQIWRFALSKGRFPRAQEFSQLVENTTSAAFVWPPEPLFSKLTEVMAIMQLPRLALRHSETIPSILVALLRMTHQFEREKSVLTAEIDQENDETPVEDDEYTYEDTYDENYYDTSYDQVELDEALSIERVAQDLVDGLTNQWSGVVRGVSILDQLFGADHNLLLLSTTSQDEDVPASAGFGIEDGVWKHSGWHVIPQLQRQISGMSELKDLVRNLGRRPTVEKSDAIHKFTPRRPEPSGGLGAEWDPYTTRESIHGLHLSSSLTEMLLSEAALLRSSALRPLFLQKLVESKLLSYQFSGWKDVPSVPRTRSRTRPLYPKRMPSAPGGPIVVCLDTSWSMSTGTREALSKAVVLACVSSALAQKRECQIVAFSSQANVMEAGIIHADDTESIQRLLDFLSNSFGGGTDVTGALKYAMQSIDSQQMTAADILLISDGEIPEPPVPDDILQTLDQLKRRKGVEVHGLLVGKRQSKPLERLCNQVHDFLNEYDEIIPTMVMHESKSSTTTTLYADKRSPRRVHSRVGRENTVMFGCFGPASRRSQAQISAGVQPLYARFSDDDDDWSGDNVRTRRKKTRKTKAAHSNDISGDDANAQGTDDPFLQRVDSALEAVHSRAREIIDSNTWSSDVLEKERQSDDSCWKYQAELKAAVDRVGEGLVERSEEARLVVLAMLSTEHILLLGVPGTGKSVLGRRLSNLCNGSFFLRLLTRFTTPEELFGPLSLRSLEKDEYRRVTTGYLPTASVAFLDEIFKANSAILNTLLTILNERKFDNAGGQEDCPIRCVVGASNELPESDELEALFDRFLIRKEVDPVSDSGIVQLLSMSNPGYSSCNSDAINGSERCDLIFTEGLDEVIDALSLAANSVRISSDAVELIRDLRTFLREELNIETSDRRLVKASRLLKICAASNGRNRYVYCKFLA